MPIYKDTPQNRKLKRVGKGYGKECSPCEVKKKAPDKKAPLRVGQMKGKDLLQTAMGIMSDTGKSKNRPKRYRELKEIERLKLKIGFKIGSKHYFGRIMKVDDNKFTFRGISAIEERAFKGATSFSKLWDKSIITKIFNINGLRGQRFESNISGKWEGSITDTLKEI